MQALPPFNHSNLSNLSNTHNTLQPGTRIRVNIRRSTRHTRSRVTSHRISNPHTRITRPGTANTLIINPIPYTGAKPIPQACWTIWSAGSKK